MGKRVYVDRWNYQKSVHRYHLPVQIICSFCLCSSISVSEWPSSFINVALGFASLFTASVLMGACTREHKDQQLNVKLVCFISLGCWMLILILQALAAVSSSRNISTSMNSHYLLHTAETVMTNLTIAVSGTMIGRYARRTVSGKF